MGFNTELLKTHVCQGLEKSQAIISMIQQKNRDSYSVHFINQTQFIEKLDNLTRNLKDS